MKNTILFVLVISCCSFYLKVDQEGISKRSLKKIDKELSKIWENETIIKSEFEGIVTVSEFELKGYEKLYKLTNQQNQLQGYMFLSKAPGRYDDFDLMVIYDQKDLTILGTSVLIYREEYGGEIGSPRWLKQFLGKNFSNTFRLDYEIQGISGATISVRSATEEIKRLSLLLKKLQDKDLLN